MPNAKSTISFGADERLAAAIGLLAALTSSRAGRVPADALMRDLSLERIQLESVVEALQQLSDNATGARAIVYIDGNDVVLEGTAARLDPLRFLPDEAAAVTTVLERFHLATDVRKRIEAALAPATPAHHEAQLAADAMFGAFYQTILIAIVDGMPLRILYRSGGDETARERLIDPHVIEVMGDKAYLVAWDRAKDAQRRYRLDRIQAAELLDETAERHEYRRESIAEGIAAVGSTAVVDFKDPAAYEVTAWAGIHRDQARLLSDGSVRVPVSYTLESWLFDQVLAAGGDIVIQEPAALRARLAAYASTILA